MQPGFRSPWARNVGGAERPTTLPAHTSGDRSALFYWGGGAAKSPNHGDYAGPRSMLAFWMGGACLNYKPVPPEPPFVLVTGPDGIPYAQRHGGRPFIDDDEVIEFLRLWTVWNDIE